MPPNERLLTTKIQVPPLPPKTVRRARLLEALDRGLQPNLRLSGSAPYDPAETQRQGYERCSL
jgi:ATP/maltotriose-dependent transcriptional regulator MalT